MFRVDNKTIQSVSTMSDNNEYRYRLTRTWDDQLSVSGIIMLNPSKANVLKTDDTVMNITNYLIDHGYGGIDIVNLFAYMATKPKDLVNRCPEYEAQNDSFILRVIEERRICIVAWGSDETKYVSRKREVEKILRSYAPRIKCFMDEDGKKPRHPLHLKDTWDLVPYEFIYIGEDEPNERNRN